MTSTSILTEHDYPHELEEEIQRLGGARGVPLDGLLCNVEATAGELRAPESEAQEAQEARRADLLSLAAWALLALRYEDAHPGLDLEEVAEP